MTTKQKINYDPLREWANGYKDAEGHDQHRRALVLSLLAEVERLGAEAPPAAWKRDPEKDSPIRHESGCYLTWDKLDLLLRATEAYGWALVVAGKSDADVKAERDRNDQLHHWLWRLRQGRYEGPERDRS